jgi:hypothetical protein
LEENMSSTRLTAAILAATLCTVITCGSDRAWAQNASQRFRAYDGPVTFDPSRVSGLRAASNVKVVVVMSEDSIATARSRSATHTISDSERAGVEQRVAAQHESVRPDIESHGGTVLAKFHGALNGIKVDIHPSQIGALAALPGVVKVLPVGKYHVNNITSVPFIGTPAVWQGTPGFRGENIKIAIIDTGIDYTHANFGGPGTVAPPTPTAHYRRIRRCSARTLLRSRAEPIWSVTITTPTPPIRPRTPRCRIPIRSIAMGTAVTWPALRLGSE